MLTKVTQHIKKDEKKRNIRKQLYFIYMLSIFMPISIIGLFLVINNYSLIYEQHKSTLVSDNLRVRSIIFEITTSITNISDNISSDTDLYNLIRRQYLDFSDANLALENYKELDNYYGRHTEISTITLYTSNKTLHNNGHIKVITEAMKEESWYQQTINNPNYFWSTLSSMNNFKVPYSELQFAHKIPIPNSKDIAILVITVSNNYLKNRIDNNKLDVDISANDGLIFYSTWGQSGKSLNFPIDFSNSYYSYSGYENYKGSKELIELSTFKPIKSYDRLNILSQDKEAASDLQSVLLIALSIVIISVLIPWFLIRTYTKQFSNRIETLRTEMHRVSGGDYNIIETFKGNDELKELFIDLKSMIGSIKQRDEAIFNAQINEQKLINHQQQMEMEILSSKINPHFLYNTLETIRMKAFDVDDLEVAEAVKLLGKYMRHNLESTGESITLEADINYIDIYQKIQSLRFNSRITTHIDVDPTLPIKKIMILPLLIQPLIENAYVHGHDQTISEGTIELIIRQTNDCLNVLVRDNGVGLTSERLIELRNHINIDTKPATSSFGLYNIHQRIRIFYGNAYGLTINGQIGMGTEIGFTIPLVYKEDSHV